jgi:hypothetical protein
MLFDLRSKRRRRLVQSIYLMLAVLMGGGLVFFGIGGATSGGLFDAISGNSGSSGNGAFEKRVSNAQKTVRIDPANQAAWATLARAEYQLAGVGENYDQGASAFTAKGKAQLRKADRAWQRYLSLNPAKVDASLANQMVQAYGASGLNDATKAVRAQEIVIDSQPPSSGQYANLAVLAYAAGQTRKGDLARGKALELAPKDQREVLKSSIDDAKQAQATQQAQPTTAG